MYRASCSLPTPVSPSRSTVASSAATFRARLSTSKVTGSLATISAPNLFALWMNSISARRRSWSSRSFFWSL